LKSLDAAYAAKTPREKYENIAEYRDFKRGVWDIHHKNQPPPISWFVSPDTAMEDDDVVVDQEIQSLKCPLTLVLLEKPVRNKQCPHVYSLDAIKQVIKNSGGSCVCPISGCGTIVTLNSIREDKAMARKVRDEKERLEEAAAEGMRDVQDLYTDGTQTMYEDIKIER
jgi:SUMO ligase MMS21 Smc5/6 complex component